MNSLRTHYIDIAQHFDNTDGTLTVEAIARSSGTMRYRSDSGDRIEFVPPELIDARDDKGRPVMGSLGGAPNTNEHPAQVVRYSADSRKALQVGKVRDEVHIYTDADGERSVKVRFDVSDAETIADIKSGKKRGVSLGYLCNVIPEDGEYKGVRYTHRQGLPIVIDHLAIVSNPRNPSALITRFDSEDVAWSASPERSEPGMSIVRVDACCSACTNDTTISDTTISDDDIEEIDILKDRPMTPVIFRQQVLSVDAAQLEAMIHGGIVDVVRADGRDYFVAMDVALDMRADGLMGGVCGAGWEGTSGRCQRRRREEKMALRLARRDRLNKINNRKIGRLAANVGKAALIGGAAAYVGRKIAKNPGKAALIGTATIGGAALIREGVKRAKKNTDSLDMKSDGVMGGACGPGWEGTRGNCRRKKRNLGRLAANVGKAALIGGAAAYVGRKIAKNPRKAALIGAATIGGAALLRQNVKRAMNQWDVDMQNTRASKARSIELDPPSRISQNKRAARVKQLSAGSSSTNQSTYVSAGAGGKGPGSKAQSVVIPSGTSVKAGRAKKSRPNTGNPGISKYPWRNKQPV